MHFVISFCDTSGTIGGIVSDGGDGGSEGGGTGSETETGAGAGTCSTGSYQFLGFC